GLVGPVIMVKKRFFLCWLSPQRQCVVGEMIVQIDEAGDNKSIACIDYWRTCKSGGGWRSSGSDSFYEAIISEVDAAGEDSRRIRAAHGNDAAGDYKRHRCLRVILYFRVASVRTENSWGPGEQ